MPNRGCVRVRGRIVELYWGDAGKDELRVSRPDRPCLSGRRSDEET